jgi:hypothetical protein
MACRTCPASSTASVSPSFEFFINASATGSDTPVVDRDVGVVAAGHDRHGGRSGGTAWCPGRARAPAAPGIPTAARRRAPARSPAGQLLGRRGRAGPDCGGTMPTRHSSGADRLRSRPPSLDPVQPEHLGRIGAAVHRPPARVSNVALAAGRLVPPRADAWPRHQGLPDFVASSSRPRTWTRQRGRHQPVVDPLDTNVTTSSVSRIFLSTCHCRHTVSGRTPRALYSPRSWLISALTISQ